MENNKRISYDPDGAQMINDSANRWWVKIKKSWPGKSIKRLSKFVRREGAKQPLWKFVLGLIVCTCLAWITGFKKYWIEKLFIQTLFNIWNALINNTFGFLIKGWSDNKKVN